MWPGIERLSSFERFGIHLGLERMEALLGALADPQERIPAVHVAGTNGKGSVAAMLAEALGAAGYRAGLYTSPHLQRKPERIQVDGRAIAEAELESVLKEEVYPAVDALDRERYGNPTEFEVLTAAAWVAFRRAGVQVSVMEVGLGGRLDATNVLARPLAVLITPLSFDHTERLGTSLPAIAAEKAGIVKPGRPVASAGQPAEALAVIEERCRQLGAPLTLVAPERLQPGARRPDAQAFRWRRADGSWCDYELGLIGRHQLDNVALALIGLELLAQQGYELPEAAVQAALRRVRWPGRLELIPGPGCTWLLDGAHNPAGTSALAQALADHFPGRRWVLVFAAVQDKDVRTMLAPLLPLVAAGVVTQAPLARAMPAAQLRKQLGDLPLGWEVCADHRQALARAAQIARSLDPSPTGVLVCGSLYLIGATRAVLHQPSSLLDF